MKTKILSLANEEVGEISLNEDIFAVEFIRDDIIKQVIDWQRAKAMSGNHKTKTVSEVLGTTKKPFKQKGTGNARQGSLRSVQMRGGGVAHGPRVRSHATKLPKKVRKLGLIHALSEKCAEGKLLVIDSLKLDKPKTSALVNILNKFQGKSFFVIDGNEVDINFSLAAKNIYNTVVVPQIGANVYDIIRHEYVLLSQEAVSVLEERLR
ncbi:50S ribosomal protein L4 [Rickettsia rickettsii]|uniref:Large ribosomal subunit protein uL4 n=2 Tax=Rickettsia rickettsii TaxID=783 RepID=RL4_RICRO|nr:50S ribosomal protein L4 [Rickettsia rickettsii]A8GT68.1 RecName: Full=Large ribosomal subunit protein uL4; AltName: Full=50S ribosomal protein L4 [Rickettsia rickettsii str. 'Sheila Smith']B0BUQ9.1 RecName: Full=Large ribosomal subunit protein uL4; AltName: Full=50S ribosomal protein L4 [Rickettsia rickettsii str. Iowa]ABV76593.1 50S ribosomal protein L4 [Rickettsia rickettsii str. 'Sheila Smith']ABY72969.1 LSU ribosomal protein L1E (= L4P) [Rickettsia rickettsii str. Iowa]AFB21835.1 50S r